MKKTYIKKPVKIEAIQLVRNNEGSTNMQDVVDFLGKNNISYVTGDALVVIKTLEGEMCASINDYIIKGTEGEFYPCKPHIFEKIYDEATE
jgi:UPF0288 family protein (methanogenesis marker protein 3)